MSMEFLFEIIIVYLLSYPGALIRWLIGGCKKEFSGVMEDVFWNSTVAIIFSSVVILFLVYVSKI